MAREYLPARYDALQIGAQLPRLRDAADRLIKTEWAQQRCPAARNFSSSLCAYSRPGKASPAQQSGSNHPDISTCFQCAFEGPTLTPMKPALSDGAADAEPRMLTGHDTRSLQAYFGHRNIQNTTRYAALSPDRFARFWQD